MKTANNNYLLADSASVRIFWGYKLSNVTPEQFNKDLGDTFMPGTVAVLAPMGLNCYLPAVLGHNKPDVYPDEVALIIYPTLQLYDEARRDNLLGRIYTFSHFGSFDMSRSGGQWPGTASLPIKHPSTDRWAWRTFDRALDWQKGQCRLVVMKSAQIDLFELLNNISLTKSDLLTSLGIEEMIVQCTKGLATIWFYSTIGPVDFELSLLLSRAEQIEVINDLFSSPLFFRTGLEKATINGPTFIQFRFNREQRFYI